MFMNEFQARRLRSFAMGLVKANKIIEEKKPDLLLVPMRGSVPLIDGINVVNPNFDNSIVYYIPASSSILNVAKIIPKTIANILHSLLDFYIITGLEKKFLIMSIDEVVSGNSAIRVMKGARQGINIFARNAAESSLADKKDIEHAIRSIKSKIEYLTIGFEHGEHVALGKKRSKEYEDAKRSGVVIPVEVEFIITMDNPVYCPIVYESMPNSSGLNIKHLPVVKPEFLITQEYINLLAAIAAVVGTNPEDVCVRNLERILQHQEFIPKEFRQVAGNALSQV